jgi:hypothetical protein
MGRIAVLGLALVALAGCAGEQGDRAQQLLSRAQVAQSRLTSMSYDLRVTFAMQGQRMSLVLDGAAYLRGARAGDQLLTMRTEGVPGAAAVNMQLLIRDSTLTLAMNGRNTTMAVPSAARHQYDSSAAMLELARYVKRVKVHEGRNVNGERGATVTGVLDTEGLLKAASKLQGFSAAAGSAAPDMSEVAENLGDTRAALFVSERSGLIRSAVLALSIDAEGRKAHVDVTYRLKTVNRVIPGL